jgi:hypothetical protein
MSLLALTLYLLGRSALAVRVVWAHTAYPREQAPRRAVGTLRRAPGDAPESIAGGQSLPEL